MKAKQFEEVNVVYGENQPEYYPLPAYKSEDGTAGQGTQMKPRL